VRLTGERLRLGRSGPIQNPGRVLTLSFLILVGVGVLWLRSTERIQPLFLPTPTPTRTAASHAQEGLAYFSAGDLERAIAAYERAVELDPGNAELLAELARIQTYSSALVTAGFLRTERLAAARESADRAVAADPDSSRAHAIRALAYDWSAAADAGSRDQFLSQAESSVTRALQLDHLNPLALAFQAEVLADQQRFAQAYDVAAQAVGLDPSLMDVHRVFATVLESNGLYRQAIDEYQRAAEINPNLTFLYLLIGANYRQLGVRATSTTERASLMELALENFDRAATINEQLGIQDPIPFMAIGRTYLQEGEFIVAARNVERALGLDPGNPQVYGFLGIVYFRARNYESAIPILKCAVEGCSAEETGDLLCVLVFDCEPGSEEAAGHGRQVAATQLNDNTVEFFYTYGSVLTAYAGTAEVPDACDRAERVFDELVAVYGGDPIVSGIVAEGRAICASPGPPPGPPPGTPATSATPTP
jgi:tetratricopeptide (TPR) repeat protein